ncbi:MAG: TIGR04255 family protein [Candidatus Riflebacteria bacterium]|nr:TIGR04255 family protein [Candidatus Riflebacteria bacterium]
MVRKYIKTPLVEAVFEFAPLDAKLNEAAVKRLDSQFQSEYSGSRDEVPCSPLVITGYKDGKPVLGSPPEPFFRYRRWNSAGSRLIQFSKDLCAFNALKPYTHFEEYLPAMERFFQAFVKESNAQKTLFLGQRYINRIALPSRDEPASDYFRFFPKLDELSKPDHCPFSLNIQVDALPGEKQGCVMLTLVFHGFEESRPVYILDLYAQTSNSPPIAFDWDSVSKWQKRAHIPIENAFNSALTKKGQEFLGLEE